MYDYFFLDCPTPVLGMPMSSIHFWDIGAIEVCLLLLLEPKSTFMSLLGEVSF